MAQPRLQIPEGQDKKGWLYDPPKSQSGQTGTPELGSPGNPVVAPPLAPGQDEIVVTPSSSAYSNASQAFTAIGVGISGGQIGLPTASIGSNGNLYLKPFYGNQYVSTLRLLPILTKAGWVLAPISVGTDLYALSQGQITAGKFSLNTGMTGVGLFGGPIGAFGAGVYFVGDNFILTNEGGLWNAGYNAWMNAKTLQ